MSEDPQLLQLPERIHIQNLTGHPRDTTISDADTGETVYGVFEARLTADELEIRAALSWPISPADYLLNDPSYDGPQYKGLKVQTKKYHVKKLKLESW